MKWWVSTPHYIESRCSNSLHWLILLYPLPNCDLEGYAIYLLPRCNEGNLRCFAGGISRGWDLKGSDSAALRHVQLGPTMVPLGVVCSCWSTARRDLGVSSGCWGFDVWSCYTCPKPTHDRWEDAISRSTIIVRHDIYLHIYIYTHTPYTVCICICVLYTYMIHIYILSSNL